MIDLFEIILFQIILFQTILFQIISGVNNNRESNIGLKNQPEKIVNLKNDRISHIFNRSRKQKDGSLY